MILLEHAEDCAAVADGELPSFHVTFKPSQDWATVQIRVSECCPGCLNVVDYVNTRTPQWRMEQGWPYRLRTWWGTFQHRNGGWERPDQPPF